MPGIPGCSVACASGWGSRAGKCRIGLIGHAVLEQRTAQTAHVSAPAARTPAGPATRSVRAGHALADAHVDACARAGRSPRSPLLLVHRRRFPPPTAPRQPLGLGRHLHWPWPSAAGPQLGNSLHADHVASAVQADHAGVRADPVEGDAAADGAESREPRSLASLHVPEDHLEGVVQPMPVRFAQNRQPPAVVAEAERVHHGSACAEPRMQQGHHLGMFPYHSITFSHCPHE